MKIRKTIVVAVVAAGLFAGCAQDRPDSAQSSSRTKNAALSTFNLGATLQAMQQAIKKALANAATALATTSTIAKATTTTIAATTTAPKAATTTVAPTTTAAPTTTVASSGPCTVSQCRVGDTGPNGGVVFITPSTPGNTSGWYFEAKPASMMYNQAFGCGSSALPNTGSAIGDGPANTAAILRVCGKSSLIGQLSQTAIADESKAWFLPSSGELLELLKNVKLLKGNSTFKYGEFWSSTASDASSMFAAGSDLQTVSPRPRTQAYDATLVAAFTQKPRAFNIGDLGPAGGRVFISPSTAGNTTGKYFEVAPTDWSGTAISKDNMVFDPQVAWSCSELWSVSLPGTGTAIGTGQANTKKINEACATTKYTGKYATAEAIKYRGGGRDDWFVPSKDELFQMYNHDDEVVPSLSVRSPQGSYRIVCAWSSSEMDSAIGYGGNQLRASDMYATTKQIGTNCVIPVRMFDADKPGLRTITIGSPNGKG